MRLQFFINLYSRYTNCLSWRFNDICHIVRIVLLKILFALTSPKIKFKYTYMKIIHFFDIYIWIYLSSLNSISKYAVLNVTINSHKIWLFVKLLFSCELMFKKRIVKFIAISNVIIMADKKIDDVLILALSK